MRQVRHIPSPAPGPTSAQWFRTLAAEVEETDPQRAIYCRRVAEMIEANVIGNLPLRRMTEDTHERA